MNQYKDKNLIFGLDIGTRTVIGNVGYIENNKWTMVECVCMAHEDRAMIDGQIHDIQKVADIVARVKRHIESKLQVQLKQVAIAAAGRVLNTQIAHVEQSFEEIHEVTKDDIQHLEMTGIDEAKKMLELEHRLVSSEYFCVAHTVIHYYLDEYMIANLEGHKGQTIGAQILATFLPKGVVDSLYAVTERVGLEVSHLTLEPIAAINAVIPENVRLLNLALVDVGAGTSDIAITKEGSIVAYGMIPVAGDEVTEAIVHQYLVDFNTAEEMKQALGTDEEITYEDIIGISYTLSKQELLDCIEEPLNKLADSIAKKILKLNGKKSTNAVFCVGGGSRMPGLIEKIATALELNQQRVAMRSTEHIQNIIYECTVPNGPEMITPIGICLTAAKDTDHQFVRVKINDEEVKLLNTKKLTVLDALLQGGITHKQIFPTNGKTLMFKLNGERIRMKGQIGQPSTLLLNNQPTSLEETIQDGDTIILIEAKHGSHAEVMLSEYIQKDQYKVVDVEGEKIMLPILLANGDCVDPTYQIKSQDQIEIISIHNLKELLDTMYKDIKKQVITVNFEIVPETYILKDGDSILINTTRDELNLVEEKIDEEEQRIEVIVNDEVILLPYQEQPYMFVNIFDYIDFDLTKPKGTVQLLLNNERAAVTDRLKDGDKLQIYWEN